MHSNSNAWNAPENLQRVLDASASSVSNPRFFQMERKDYELDSEEAESTSESEEGQESIEKEEHSSI